LTLYNITQGIITLRHCTRHYLHFPDSHVKRERS